MVMERGFLNLSSSQWDMFTPNANSDESYASGSALNGKACQVIQPSLMHFLNSPKAASSGQDMLNPPDAGQSRYRDTNQLCVV